MSWPVSNSYGNSRSSIFEVVDVESFTIGISNWLLFHWHFDPTLSFQQHMQEKINKAYSIMQFRVINSYGRTVAYDVNNHTYRKQFAMNIVCNTVF